MLTTIVALVVALIYFFSGSFPLTNLEMIAPLTGSLCFLVTMIAISWAIIPLQKTARHVTSYVVNCFRFDTGFAASVSIAFIYAFLTFVVKIEGKALTLAWIILLGLAMDAALHVVRRVLVFNDPQAVLNEISKASSRYWDIYSRLDALTETAYKAFVDSHIALSESALEHVEEVIENHLEKEGKEEKQPGELNYFLCYVFQHLDPLVREAVAYHCDPIVSKVVLLSGKIALHLFSIRPEEMSLPLHYLAEYVSLAIEQGLSEVGIKGSVTLQTIAKEILKRDDLEKSNLKDGFFILIDHLDSISKAIFKKDKTTNIALLQDPFRELLEYFKMGKMKDHPDAAAIQMELVRVLAEYQALENVMLTMPSGLSATKPQEKA